MKDRAYHRDYSRNYYHERIQELIDFLGGYCGVRPDAQGNQG